MPRPTRLLTHAFLGLFAGLLLGCGAAPAEVVPVDGGEVRAQDWNDSLLFRGIPFAAPPLGSLRWKPPQPVVPWKGVRESVEAPPSCIQGDQGWNHSDFLNQSEDCLTLDVRTPKLGGKLPVLVWVHGGSNRFGGPNDIILSDMGKSVVIVGIRYRLGVFGFLSHRALTAEQGASGNYALMDQVAALNWVRRNIARFGGDPNNVTIAGESAGSKDVGLMLAIPAARPLFAKAIMESGTPGFGLAARSLREAEQIGDQLGSDLARLRAMPAEQLLAADGKLHDPAAPDDSFTWLRTTIDGKAVPADPTRLLAAAPPKPVIVGSNRLEFGVGGGAAERDRLIASTFGSRAAQARAYYRVGEPEPPPDPRLGSRDEQIATDIIFRCPAGHTAAIMAGRGAPVWRYEFDAAQDGGKTAHAAEIPYAFGTATFGGYSLTPYWLNFIRSGDPNGPGLPTWPKFTAGAQQHVRFSDAGVTTHGPLRAEVCSLTDRI